MIATDVILSATFVLVVWQVGTIHNLTKEVYKLKQMLLDHINNK